jgi:toxin FitB
MKWLVDANVLSEATRREPDPRVIAWLTDNEPEITVDPIVLGEIRFGILLLPRGARRKRLERWFDDGVRHLQCVAWDAQTGLQWAQLLASLRARVTLNVRDFESAGLTIVDPRT